jgi:hypothetical protein
MRSFSRDLKSRDSKESYRFDSDPGHHSTHCVGTTSVDYPTEFFVVDGRARCQIMTEIMTVLGLGVFSFSDSVRKIFRVGDGVALEHLARLPSTDVHNAGLGNPSPAEFACCRTSQAVDDPPNIFHRFMRFFWRKIKELSSSYFASPLSPAPNSDPIFLNERPIRGRSLLLGVNVTFTP